LSGLFIASDTCRLLKRIDFAELKFGLYIVGYEKVEDIPADQKDRTLWTFTRKATIQLKQ